MTSEYGDTQSDAASLDQMLDYMRRDLWAGAVVLRGALPTFPNVAALPVASADWRGKAALVLGAPGDADVIYLCLKAAADTYSWVSWATG